MKPEIAGDIVFILLLILGNWLLHKVQRVGAPGLRNFDPIYKKVNLFE